MTIRILVNGANGKMGSLAVKTLMEHAQFQLVGKTDHGVNLTDEIKKSKAEVVVDFTNADVVFLHAKTIIEAGAHPVIGTSGLLKDEIKLLQEKCDKLQLGGIIAPNFSIGAVLMMKQAAEIAKFFPDMEIIEMHHPGKYDSPSGTAIRTAEILASARARKADNNPLSRETIPHARGAAYEQIPIHAIRLPGLLAHQEIIFGGPGETLTIRHDTMNRECFMPGVVLACQKVMHLTSLVYGLEHLMKIEN